MKKVVTINLNGNAYQLDEDAYEALGLYLESAHSRLRDNPDLEEIMSDLEQAIADKVKRFLGPNKTVVSGREIDEIIEEMGPVDSPPPDESDERAEPEPEQLGPGEPTAQAPERPRRLYRLTGGDEKMLAGICAGIGAYFGIDSSIVRLVFLALAFATGGFAFLGYLALILIIPEAETPEQRAAAYGVPFDARGVIDRAKSRFGELGSGGARQSHHRQRGARKAGREGTGAFLGVLVLVFGVLIGMSLLMGLVNMFAPQMFYGPVFYSTPSWMTVVMIALGVYLLAWLFVGGGRGDSTFLGSFLMRTVQVLLVLFVLWFAYHTLPFVRNVIHGTQMTVYRLVM